MNTIIEEKELNYELQELHLLSTGWQSEVQFLTGEMNFLKKLINQRLKKAIADVNPEKAQEINLNITTLEQNINSVKLAIINHVKYLEKLIMDPSQQFQLSIIEDHMALERKITEDFILIRSCKQDLFSLVS
ncbi:MAG TPA: hypothetical protein VGD22_00295 [Sphingobacteriaceae bacterium]